MVIGFNHHNLTDRKINLSSNTEGTNDRIFWTHWERQKDNILIEQQIEHKRSKKVHIENQTAKLG